jgi:hypothetical protein
VVIGTAVADPWGIPGAELDRHVVLERFARYGNHVAQLAAGPFAVADLARASLTAALNGIIPVCLSRGARVVVGSHPEVVAALANTTASVQIPAGASASVDGTIANVARFGVCESLPLMRLHALHAEVERHVRRAGPWREVRRGVFADGSGQLDVRWSGGALVALPRLRSLRRTLKAGDSFDAIRQRIGDLWWQAALHDITLFVPALERPALDSLTLMMRAN